MTFELTGDVCISVSRCGKCFWDSGHVQESVRRMAKHTVKEFQEVSEVSNTSPNPRIWSFLKSAIPWFTSWSSSYSSMSLQTSRCSGCILALS